MIKLTSIYRVREHEQLLYDLLTEREPHQAISHKRMPTLAEHAEFVRSQPYQAWYFISVEGEGYVGAVYLSKSREIGCFVFKRHQGRGYGREAVEALMRKWPGRFLANVAPTNPESRRFFERLGFRHIQDTLERAHEQ